MPNTTLAPLTQTSVLDGYNVTPFLGTNQTRRPATAVAFAQTSLTADAGTQLTDDASAYALTTDAPALAIQSYAPSLYVGVNYSITVRSGYGAFELALQPQTIYGRTGTLVISRNALPAVPQSATPSTAAVALAGNAPLQTLTEPSSLPAVAMTMGYAPTVVASTNVVVSPSAAALGAQGRTAAESQGDDVTVATANANEYLTAESGTQLTSESVAQLIADASFAHFQLESGAGTFLLESGAGRFALESQAAASVISIQITGYLPALSQGRVPLAGVTGAAVITGYGVALGTGQTLPTAAATLAGSLPVAAQAFFVTVPTAVTILTTDNGAVGLTSEGGVTLAVENAPSLALTGYAAGQGLGVAPSTAALVAAGYAPAQGLAVVAPTGALGAQGAGPLESQFFPRGIGTDVGVLALTGYAPATVVPVMISPLAAALAAAGYTPAQELTFSITVNAGAISFTYVAPNVAQVGAVVPTAAALNFSGYAPSMTVAGTIAPFAGAMSTAASAPAVAVNDGTGGATGVGTLTGVGAQVTQSFLVTPSTMALGLSGYAPSPVVPVQTSPFAGATSTQGYAPALLQAGPPVVTSVGIEFLSYGATILFYTAGGTVPVQTINDLNSLTVQCTFTDDDGNPYVPAGLQWRLWDDTNKVIVQDWTSPPPPLGSTYQFEIVGSFNSIYNDANLSERRIVILQTTIPGGEVRYDDATYNILNIPSIETN
jgi:hypothetical protein